MSADSFKDAEQQVSDGHSSQYASKKGIWGWVMMDWAMQPFHTLIMTFAFAPFFASVVAPNPVIGQEMWGYAVALGAAIIALSSPVLGAIADNYGPRKPWIIAFIFMGTVGAWCLWYVVPAASNDVIFWGLAAFILCMIGLEFCAVFVNAIMPDLVPREKMGRLSGTSWGVGYIGGLITLVIVLGFLAINPETGKTLLGFGPMFGLDPAMREGDRMVGPLTGLWLLAFSLPFLLFTPDSKRPDKQTDGALNVAKKGILQFGQTVKALPKTPSLFAFLSSSMLYRDALNGLYAFGGIYAAGVLGWSLIELGTFGILANLTGAFGAWIGGRMDDKFGTKKIIYGSIFLLIIASLSVISTSPTEVFFVSVAQGSNLPNIMFYVFGGLIGATGGALQASSRVLLTDQASEGKMTEAFGLYALSGRATSFIAPLSIAWATGFFDSQRIGVMPVVILFVLGFVLLAWVKNTKPVSTG